MENAAMQYNFRSAVIREEVFPAVCAMLGTPVMIDAAQFGSYAHHMRNFWQNFSSPGYLGPSLAATAREPGLIAQDILHAGRSCAPVHQSVSDKSPFY